MESRIKQLREKRGLIQEILAVELGITQQMLSMQITLKRNASSATAERLFHF